jgi:hypothetical protein
VRHDTVPQLATVPASRTSDVYVPSVAGVRLMETMRAGLDVVT